MPKARGEIREFGNGFYRVRLLGKIICLSALLIQHKNASNACQTDVIIEKWSLKNKRWQPLKLTVHGRDIVFRCASLKPDGLITFHHFVYYLKLQKPLNAAAYKKWRQQCIAKNKDVDHTDRKVWRVIRDELELINASSNRAKNGRD